MNIKITAAGSRELPIAWDYSAMTFGSLAQPPLIAGDRLICVTDKAVYALDIYTGKEVANEKGGFPHRLGVSFDDQPAPTHSRGAVFFMDGGKLICRQLSDGNIPTRLVDGKRVPRWTPPKIAGVTSLNANDDVVVVTHADPDTRICGFEPWTGAPLWGPVKVSKFSPGPVSTTRDAVVFISGGHLFAVNIRSGDTRFDFAPSDPLSAAEAPQVGEVGNKSVVVATGTAAYGVDLRNGNQLWVHKAGNTRWCRPAISERYNRVVLGNKNNELFVLELTTGVVKWKADVPDLAQVSIVGDQVYAGGRGSEAKLHVYNLASGKKAYTLQLDDPGRMGLMTGHGILFIPGEKNIRAIPFADQNAALFNGRSSRITVSAPGGQFDFRENDFTIESWICTTTGGEVMSGFPTATGNEHHGFRVNVTDQGRLRFAVINRNADSSFAAVSTLTNLADGSWHHVAVVRRGDGVEMYVDGISAEVQTAVKGSKPLDINGKSELTIGAFVPGGGQRPQAYFNGLMRELRVWDIALDAAKLQSRMQLVLTGKEPHMLGYWRMNEDDAARYTNRVPVPRHGSKAKPDFVRPFVTELALDVSAFPYLLDQVKLQWPYAGHWSARGESEITTGPALDRTGVLAFGTGNMLYGVLESDGARAWSKATPSGASTPVADGGVFYCVTGKEGMIALDAHTGDVSSVEGFDGFIKTVPPAGTYLPAPAVNANYIAAASPTGQVWVVEKSVNEKRAWVWSAPEKISGDLSIADGRVYVTAGTKLYQLDPSTKRAVNVNISGPHTVAHGGSVFYRAGANIARFASSDITKPLAYFKVPDGVTVTGMAASSDLDLLVVSTDKGDLHGLTFATLASRWTTRVPAATASSRNSLNTPSISERAVFCTSTSGAVVAVDAHTGEFRGLFFEPASIKTAPLVDSGEVYFGCEEAPADANLLDGALHSVVFGQTHVLRLNLDRNGAKETTTRSYVSVTKGKLLTLMGVWESCVEAWVNTKEGGEVLSICTTPDSLYGLRLWLDRDGKINFTCVDLPDEEGAKWELIKSSASSSACDGKWHHIAVARSARDRVTIYLDGVALNATTTLSTTGKPLLSPGIKVFIGANATEAGPSNFFAGMIGEVRVWDTYLTATRIAARMHDKLIGNEPDLLAYWNFDKLTLQDGARNGHEGSFDTEGGSPGYWLADLNFTHPSYPFIETTGRMLQEGAEGSQGELANTIYELSVVARKADGTPLGDQDIRLWYVRHKLETGPDTIGVSTSKGNAQLKAVSSSHGDEESLVGKTGKDGKVIFRLTTSEREHGPSLDLRPAFLPANERYHVNVLIDNQKLEKPAPPRLEAQATLIQDYHWSTGDTVNHERDRQTWRAVITTLNSDGRPRAGERFQLWATEHCEVEVDGRVYPINPYNYQTFAADEKGELTVALAAKDLRAPKLSVWAGFMHRDERYTIPLDQDAHKKLSELEADDLAQPRMTNWKPGYDANKDDKALVKEGYKPHAPKVATAIQHVMSVTQEPEQPMRAPLQKKRARLLKDRRNFGDMRQTEPTPTVDGVRSLRTLKHIDRQMPLEPESFKLSLNQELGFENSVGFVFTKKDLSLQPIKSLAQVKSVIRQTPPQAPQLLGNIFEDAWNAIESAAEAVWREAQKIAIYIADQVTLVIEYAEKVVEKVVQTVKEAVEAVVHILKMIEAFIEDVIRFLTTLFDWGAILEAHKILKQIANNQMRAVIQITSRGKDDFSRMLMAAFKGSAPVLVDTSQHPQISNTASSARANDSHPEIEAQVNSVPGKYVDDKVDEHKGEINYNLKPAIKPGETPIDQDVSTQALELAGALGGSLSDPLGVSFADIYQSIQDLLSGDVDKVILRMLKPWMDDFDKIGKALGLVQDALNAPIDIPFLSQLYKWITGEQLTILDVTCLALAIPTHIGYTVYTLLTTGEIHSFADDARHLKNYQLTAPQLYGETPLVQSRLLGDEKVSHDRAMHWSYFVFYSLNTIHNQVLKMGQIEKGPGEWKKDPIKVGSALTTVATGLVAKTLLYTAGMKEENWNDFDKAWNSTLYGILIGLDLYTAYDAFQPHQEPDGGLVDTIKDHGKQIIKIGVSIGGCVLLGLRIDAWVNNKSPLSDLFQTRDVLNAIAMMFAFNDTSYFVKAVGPTVATYVIVGESWVKLAAGAVHIAAVVKE
jgi:outer membrane protein assembly factor BamB